MSHIIRFYYIVRNKKHHKSYNSEHLIRFKLNIQDFPWSRENALIDPTTLEFIDSQISA